MSGVAGWKATNPNWEAVDNLAEDCLIEPDPALAAALKRSEAAGLPDIAVSATQGKFLQLLVQLCGAQRILEIGTLGAYSTIWMMRAAGPKARAVTIEENPDYAVIARQNLEDAGISGLVDVRIGNALEILDLLSGPFDFVFIDADKQNNVNYIEFALSMATKGALIVVDNVVREGEILDPKDESAEGTRALYEHLRSGTRLDSTILQSVGSKGWDGMLIARVK